MLEAVIMSGIMLVFFIFSVPISFACINLYEKFKLKHAARGV